MEVQNVIDYCVKCANMKDLIEKRKQKIPIDDSELQEIRNLCRYCRNLGKKGIYKADAILTSLEMYEKLEKLEKKKNVGKKATREKQYGTVVQNLRTNGMTIREIAKTVGISVDTVQKILKHTSIKSIPVQEDTETT